jgi:TonB-dependent receptor
MPLVAFGQSTLQGVVTDSLTSEKLIGINVILEGTSLGSATNVEGEYRITGIPQRFFTVKVSCIGYETKRLSIDLTNSASTQLNVKLKQTIIQGEAVVITAQMRGQVAAINQQLTATSIVNVVSEEKIKELPDANAAESIGRLPGVSLIRSGGEATGVVLRGLSSKFSNITVDGVKIPATDPNTRDVDLSTLSQGSLAGIELYKTLTPDQDADAIAGAVNLVTRKAPSEREVRFDLSGDYNSLMKSAKQFNVIGRYGERFFGDVLGVQLQANSERKIRSKEDITYTYEAIQDPLGGPFPTDYNIGSFTVDFTDEVRTRNGGQAILDLNTPDSGTVKLSGVYGSTLRQFSLDDRVYPHSGSTLWDYNYRYTEQNISTTNGALQGKNYLAGLTTDWGVSYAHSRISNPYDFAMRFTEPASSTSGGTTGFTRDHPEIFMIPFALNNWQAATCSTSVFYKQENFDRERTAHLDLSKKVTVSDMLAEEIKIGGKYKERTRWMDNAELDDNNYLHPNYASNLDGSAKDFTGTRFEDYFKNRFPNQPSLADFVDPPASSRDLLGLYMMNPLINIDALRQWYDLNKNGKSGAQAEYISSARTAVNDYAVTERVSSGYLMTKSDIGQDATFILGLRMEREQNDYKARFAPGGLGSIGIAVSGELKDSTTNHAETIWLPNAQLTLRPTDFLNVRLAAYRALARPDYNLRLPVFFVASGPPATFVIGNPGLKDAKAWNFEMNTQLFSGKLGLVSVSAFYKVIDDLFHQTNNVQVSWINAIKQSPDSVVNTHYKILDSLIASTGAGWQKDPRFVQAIHTGFITQVSMAYNSTSPSYAWGFELEHQMNLGFLPVAWLQHITLSYNISVTRSQTDIILSKTVPDSAWAERQGSHPAHWQQQSVQIPVVVTRQSEDQPKLYANAALGYDIAGFSWRISMFYQDRFTKSYSTNGTTDQVVDSFTKFDLALKQQITPIISLILNFNNLTNRKDETSSVNNLRLWDIPLTAELYGRTMDFGVRILL